MIFVDTSVWIDFLRGTGSKAHEALKQTIRDDQTATSGPVIMELFSGARNDQELRHLRAALSRSMSIRCDRTDFLYAAEIMRTARRTGETIRNSMDCLIAATAIRSDLPILHADRDFETIARYSELKTITV